MANPFDYIGPLADIPSASDSFTKGIMTAEALDAIRKKNAAEKMALDQQVQMQSDLGLLYQNPTISGINRVMARYPAMADKFKPLLDSMTEQQKTARIQQANNVFMPLLHGDRATAIEQLKLNETAAKNSGDEAAAQSLGMMRKLVESTETGKAGDNMVLASVGSFLSAAMGDKEFAKTYEALEKARLEREMVPLKLSKAQADAMISQNKANYGENKQTLNTSSGIYERQDDGTWKNTGMMPFAQPGVTVNYGAGQAGVSKETGEPVVYQLDQKTGKVRVVEGVAPTGNITEAQSAALGFGLRAMDSNKILNELEKESLGDINTYAEKAKAAVPFIGNALTKSKFQEYEQAKLNFITAVLRKESGAAIGKDEFTKEDRKYFPQPGDSPSVIKQKKNARSTQIMVLQEQAGRPLVRKVKGGYEREVDAGGAPSQPQETVKGATSVDELMSLLNKK